MAAATATLPTYAFGQFELDPALYELRRQGARVAIEPKALDLLTHLIGLRHRVVGKEELLKTLWPREFVTEASLTYCIKAARQAIDDDGARQAAIATVRGRGYRFVAPVTEVRATAPAPAAYAAAAPAAPATRPAGVSSFFVGREQAMATLHGALENALAARGRIVLLVGEAGIGKTRTAEELSHVAAQRGALVLFARCYEGDGAPAFWPWVQVVRSCVNEREPSAVLAAMDRGAADLAQLVPEIARWLPSAAAAAEPLSDQTRFRLFDSTTAFLRRTGDAQPVVVVLDDLHWADPASLLLLQFLAHELAGTRLLVLGTYRDERRAADDPLTQCLGELARLASCQRLDLEGLQRPDVARFIEATTGRPPAPAVVDAVAEQTGGNPFFMNELVRLLMSDGGRAPSAAGVSVPGGAREAVARRVQLLSAPCQALLPVAAVIGREFELPSLGHAFGRPRNEMLDAVDEAVAARLIEPMPEGAMRFRFVHALVRETLYEALSSRERARLHARAGDAIAAVHAEHLDPHLTVLAHHYAQAAVAGDPSLAIDYAVRAGRRAASSWAYEEAVAQFERALALRERSARPAGGRARAKDTASRETLLVELGDNLWKLGRFERAREYFERAAELARTQRSPVQLARAALGYGGGFRGFEVGVIEPHLIDLLEESLRALPRTPSALRARVMARLAVALYHVPDSLERRQALSREAVAQAAHSGDATAHLAALYSRHWAIWGPENLADRLEAAASMIRIGREIGDRDVALHGHRFHLIDSMEIGDLAAIEDDLAGCTDLANAMRQPYYLWYAAYLRAARVLLDGRLADAERLSGEALAIGQRAQTRNAHHLYGGQMLWIRNEQGRLAEIEPVIRQLVDQFPALATWRCALTYVLADLGRLDEARVQFEALASRDFADVQQNAFWKIAITRIAEACAELGDARRARVLYGLLKPYAAQCTESGLGASCLGSIHHQLGRLAATMQRWNEARRHFESALAADTRLGAPHLLAHTRRRYGAMLVAQGEGKDAARACELLGHASAAYAKLGMESFVERTAAPLQRAEQLRRKAAGRIRLVR